MKILPHIDELSQDVNNRRLTIKSGDAEIEGLARFSINKIHAFTTGNNVPDLCEIQIDRRLIPQHETFESCQAEIQAVLDKVKNENRDLEAELTVVPDRDMLPSVSVPDSPLVKSLQRSVKKVLGMTPTISKGPTGGSSDHGWWLSKYPDRAFVSYGCSRGGPSHSYDEYATIDGLIDNTKIYALLMIDLLGIA
jgi:acetylornithine deacetylase/succinyl-diaminopimelate desuccinylase-like protein